MIVAVDLDGTLCSWHPGDYEAAKPFPEKCAAIRRLHESGNEIWIYTARGSSLGSPKAADARWGGTTRRQLAKWGVPFDRLIIGKPAYQVLIDDRAVVFTEDWEAQLARSADAREARSAALAGMNQADAEWRVEELRKAGLLRGRIVDAGSAKDMEELGAEKADLITAFEILDPGRDPVAYLREWSRRLAPGGALVVEVANADAAVRTHSAPAQAFSAAALKDVAKRAGLRATVTGVQRRSLADHLALLPGGIAADLSFISEDTARAYVDDLRRKLVCDTLWMVCHP